MKHTVFLLLLLGCAEAHVVIEPDAGAIEPDAGEPDAGEPDAGQPDAGERFCEAPLVAEGEHCVGWFAAASLPGSFEPAELVTALWSGEQLVRQSGLLLRYDVEHDRWDAVEATVVETAPPEGEPPPLERSERVVVGALDDGTRVLVRNWWYANEWFTEVEVDGAWQRSVDPGWEIVNEPALAFAIAPDTVLFAGHFSGRYVRRPRR